MTLVIPRRGIYNTIFQKLIIFITNASKNKLVQDRRLLAGSHSKEMRTVEVECSPVEGARSLPVERRGELQTTDTRTCSYYG